MKLNFEAEFNPPATSEEIEDVETQLGFPLPAAFRELLLVSNGFSTDEGILVYGTDQITERNATFEVATAVPHLVAIGDDSGGMAILLAKDSEDTNVYCAGHGSLPWTRIIAPSLEAWCTQEPTVDEEEEDEGYPHHHPIDVYLEGMPSRGAKALLDIKRILGLETGIGKLKAAAESGRTRILANVPYGKYRLRCQRIEDAPAFLTLCRASDPSARLPIQD